MCFCGLCFCFVRLWFVLSTNGEFALTAHHGAGLQTPCRVARMLVVYTSARLLRSARPCLPITELPPPPHTTGRERAWLLQQRSKRRSSSSSAWAASDTTTLFSTTTTHKHHHLQELNHLGKHN